MIDFRSDTVTKPTEAMKEAMFHAPVGDDVFGEDPSINALESYTAKLFGKEAGLFCSSGTQTNQIAINVHVQPGGEVICHEESHIYKYEGGGIAKKSGASVRLLAGDRGRLEAKNIAQWINPSHDVHFPLTQLVSLEDTANRGGGAVYSFEQIQEIKVLCQSLGLPLHLDGARVCNALAVNQVDPAIYGAEFDSISICLSKGLGAPVGSVLLGSKAFIQKARRVRKVMGGGMRQAGMIAAGGLFALQHHRTRLIEDHKHAQQLEETFHCQAWVKSVLAVQTNIVVVSLNDATKRDAILEQFKSFGILGMAFGPGMLRFVTHLDISPEQVAFTCEKIALIRP